MAISSSDLTGLKVNDLTVLSLGRPGTKTTPKLWRCQCRCGRIILLRRSRLVGRKPHKSCGCSRSVSGAAHHRYRGGKYVSGSVLSTIKMSAEQRQLQMEVDIPYLDSLWESQRGRCALTGIPLVLSNRWAKDFDVGDPSASLDRINSNIGYVPGNVQWVHKTVNRMKFDLPAEVFLHFCRLIATHETGV
jgi:hypothetical protein